MAASPIPKGVEGGLLSVSLDVSRYPESVIRRVLQSDGRGCESWGARCTGIRPSNSRGCQSWEVRCTSIAAARLTVVAESVAEDPK